MQAARELQQPREHPAYVPIQDVPAGRAGRLLDAPRLAHAGMRLTARLITCTWWNSCQRSRRPPICVLASSDSGTDALA